MTLQLARYGSFRHGSSGNRTCDASHSAARRQVVRDTAVLPVVFFLSPLATSIAPRLTPFFFAVVGLTLIVSALRAGMQWRELLPRQPALAACLVFAAYVFINATWSVDPLAGLGKAALILALVWVSFAAVEAAARLERRILCEAAIAFAAGALMGALFIVVELLTRGIITRTVVGWFPQLSSPKHFKISDGVLIAINRSKLDQNVNLAMFHLWPGLLALMGLARTRRTIAMILFFAVIATVVALSEHDSSQVALIASGLVVMLAWKWRQIYRQSARCLLVRRVYSCHSGELCRLRERTALGQMVAEIGSSQSHSLGVYGRADAQPSLARRGRGFHSAAERRTKGWCQPWANRGLHLSPNHGTPRPQYILANLVRAWRGWCAAPRRRGRKRRSPYIFSSSGGPTFCCGSFRRLCHCWRLRLGHVAIVVHVRRSACCRFI